MVLACAFSPGLPSYAVAGAAVGADCARGCLSVMEAFGRISSSSLPLRRAVRNWKSGLCLRPRIFQSSGVWVLLVEYWCRDACAAWLNSGYMFSERLWTNFIIFFVAVNSNPEAVFLLLV